MSHVKLNVFAQTDLFTPLLNTEINFMAYSQYDKKRKGIP